MTFGPCPWDDFFVTVLNMKADKTIRDHLLARVKQTILALEPSAEVLLYGSRARGEAARDSDWDFFILVDGEVDSARTSAIRHALYDLELETDEVLSCIVRSRDDWESPLYQAMPFHQSVIEEGLSL